MRLIQVLSVLIGLMIPVGCAQSKDVGSKSVVSDRPNILLIFTDDQGMNDLSCYGSEIPTPNIDTLATDGMKFNSWYVASSICTPSRYGLITGHYPSRSKDRLLGPLMFLEDRDKTRGIQTGETTIATVLGKSGYETNLIGKWHLGHGDKKRLPTRHGFEHFYGHTGGCVDYFTMRYGIRPDWYQNEKHVDRVGYATTEITDAAVRYLKTDRSQEKPFFLYLSYNAPHFGKGWDVGRQQTINFMQSRESDLKRVVGIDDPIRRQFAAMVLALDDGVGRVLAALNETGLDKNTMVIFMADNGGDPKYGGSNKPFRGQKATLFEGGIRVPCLMRWPGKIKSGSTTEAAVGAIDLFPTFCQMAGVNPAPYKPDGLDLGSLLTKGKIDKDRELLFELHTASALRVGDWKVLQPKEGPAMLFHLGRDPHEQNDLAARESKVLTRLQARRVSLLQQTQFSNSVSK